MNHNLTAFIIYLVFPLLLAFGCVPTDTSRHNPNENIFCDITIQFNGSNQQVKSEIRFYFKDSLSTRPYFLDQAVLMNERPMQKKYNHHKGVFYTTKKNINPNSDLTFSFINLDNKKHDIQIPISLVPQPSIETLTIGALQNLPINNQQSYILIDAQRKICQIKKGHDLCSDIKLGESTLLKKHQQDSLYQIQKKLWVKYKATSLSQPQNLLIK